MTNREFYIAITAENATITEEMIAHAKAQLAKLVAETILTTEAKTASDIAELINADATLAAQLEKPATSQKATALMKIAMAKGLVSQIEVKIPKKGSFKAYTLVG